MSEGRRLAELSRAVRESSLKRLRRAPPGYETWRPSDGAMNLADLAHHLVDADQWLFQKLENPKLPKIVGRAGEARIQSRDEYEDLLDQLERTGEQRAELLEGLSEDDLGRHIPDDRFGGDVSVWWVIVRGNLDHETHHRGQIASYLRAIRTDQAAGGEE